MYFYFINKHYIFITLPLDKAHLCPPDCDTNIWPFNCHLGWRSGAWQLVKCPHGGPNWLMSDNKIEYNVYLLGSDNKRSLDCTSISTWPQTMVSPIIWLVILQLKQQSSSWTAVWLQELPCMSRHNYHVCLAYWVNIALLYDSLISCDGAVGNTKMHSWNQTK
jgi:hypothetical protein